MRETPAFIDSLILNAVRKAIAASIRSGAIVSASQCARDIRQTYPACALTMRELEDEVIMAAAHTGVPVAIGRHSEWNRIDLPGETSAGERPAPAGAGMPLDKSADPLRLP